MTTLPIAEIFDDIARHLREQNRALVMAPPGAGKSTYLPHMLLGEPWTANGQIILLQPRRVAVRSVAGQLARLSGSPLGQTIGYQMRDDVKRSAQTRLMVMTQGVFRRRLLADPSLEGISAVIFDEYHERSIDSDLCLALSRDVQEGLRDDLKLLIMSATLDIESLTPALPRFEVFLSEGRSYPIETLYLPQSREARLPAAMRSAVDLALKRHDGSILCFLPGQSELRQTQEALAALASSSLEICPLFGGQSDALQAAALAPPAAGVRKIILATDIAETSLTVPGVHCVIDSGLRRAPFFDDRLGLTQLKRGRAAQDRLDQRRGRAGRLAPGLCLRLWAEEEMRGIPASSLPDVTTQDLTDSMLACADWGARDIAALPWTTQPPAKAVALARGRLEAFGHMSADGSITAQGRYATRLPLPADVAAMVLWSYGTSGAEEVSLLGALLSDNTGRQGHCVDLSEALNDAASGRSSRYKRAAQRAKRWPALLKGAPINQRGPLGSPGAALARARPHLLAKQRGGAAGGFKLAAGRGAFVDAHDPMANADYLVVGDALLAGQDVRITSAWPLTAQEVEGDLADLVGESARTAPNRKDGRLQIIRSRTIGALVLDSRTEDIAPGPELAAILFATFQREGLAALALPQRFFAFQARAAFAARHGCTIDLSEAALVQSAGMWLTPLLETAGSLSGVPGDALFESLSGTISYEDMRALEAAAPAAFKAPANVSLSIDYSDSPAPSVKAKLQAFFGLKVHPLIGRSGVPLMITMLSPAGRPLQSTQDLPGFWAGSYEDVKKEMRGRYPKHPWPDDPANASPSLLTKKRQSERDG